MEREKTDNPCGGACPCPRTQCERYGDCESCRKKHTKSVPYCERRKRKAPARKAAEKKG